MQRHRTPQEDFWAGDFGDGYIERNRDSRILASRLHMLSNALRRAGHLRSVLEFGPNVGLNLLALRQLFPGIHGTAVEINARAVAALREIDGLDVRQGSILDDVVHEPRDLVLTSGLLIHIAPEALPAAYANIYRAAGRFVLLAEYYNPSPVSVPYRGEADRLFKRDFAGEMMDAYPDLALVDYGFQYRHDPSFPADDLTWFLLRK